MSRLRLDAVEKCYRGKTVLSEVGLEVEDGEFCVLLGPSGSGKSTLLNIIAGLDAPDRGHILLDGRDMTEQPPQARDVSMVFQSYALYPNLSVAENIALPLRARGASRKEALTRVSDVAEMLKLSDLLARKPAQLSGGQQQRVAIGRALARTSSLFLLDEPLSSLDATLRSELRAEIKRLHRVAPRTTVYVTHDQIEAMALADRIAVLDDGKILQHDRPQVIYERPADRRVARLVGAREMNFLEGRLHLDDGMPYLRPRSGAWQIPLSLQPSEFQEGRPAMVGFRPEHGALLPDGTDQGVPARVAAVESTGPDRYVTAVTEGRELSIRLGQHDMVGPDAYIRVVADPALLSIFCSEKGRRLN